MKDAILALNEIRVLTSDLPCWASRLIEQSRVIVSFDSSTILFHELLLGLLDWILLTRRMIQIWFRSSHLLQTADLCVDQVLGVGDLLGYWV